MKTLVFFFLASCCLADQFVADLADKPGFNQGTMVLEAGVCAGVSYGIGRLLQDGGRPDLNWLGLPITAGVSLLVHSWYIREGGSNAKAAWGETGYEIGGAGLGAMPLVFRF